MHFKCPICGNQDVKYLGVRNGRIYCRKCLVFQRKSGDTSWTPSQRKVKLTMPYELTKEQTEIKDKLVTLVNEKKNTLIHAVCGAGKTEIITGVIFEFLKNKKRVGLFTPRKDLVIEIGGRLKSLFPNTRFSFVYGGHTNDLSGDIVVSTTHQVYRFKKAFDLVIIDEIDAFPYKDNDLLTHFVINSCKGVIVSLSATPSSKDMNSNEILTLYKRFHGFPLPSPKIVIANRFYLLYAIKKIVDSYIRENKICFIYVPTIKLGEKMYSLMQGKYDSLVFVYSSIKNRENIINNIHQKKYKIIITTTILERGVTFENLQVIIYRAEHHIFDLATILQICGRVGRKSSYPEGDIYLLATKNKKDFKECIQEIKKYNEQL